MLVYCSNLVDVWVHSTISNVSVVAILEIDDFLSSLETDDGPIGVKFPPIGSFWIRKPTILRITTILVNTK